MHLVLPEITSVGEVNGFFLHLVLLVLCVGLGGNCDIVVVVVADSSGMPTEFVVQLLRIGGVGGGCEVDGEGSGGGDGGVVVHDGWGVFVLAVELGEVLRLEWELSLIPVCLTYILMRKV